jgi:hypothetical protein
VAAGAELTVPDAVADQLQRDAAFKDGPAPVVVEAKVPAPATKAAKKKDQTLTAVD